MGHAFRPFMSARSRARTCSREGGQTLVEFALILPLFLMLVMGLIEFSLAFNATLSVNQASQNAALLASEAGNQVDADCLILKQIELDMQAPTDRRDVVEVQIQWTNPSGSGVRSKNSYSRTGSMSCALVSGPTISLPYTQTEAGYPPSSRCNVIAGCPTLSPAHTSVDSIGIQVRYEYSWNTPLGTLMDSLWNTGNTTTGYTFQKRNVFRLEPVL